MERPTVANRSNLSLIEDYYQRWLTDPSSVDGSWRIFFEGYDLGREPRLASDQSVDANLARDQAAVTRLIDAYREFGHYLANLDPLKLTPRRDSPEQLEPAAFGLADADLDRVFYNPLAPGRSSTLRELIAILRETSCRPFGV
jgi:2-oxoglutarate dehydrogenase E1 component